MSVIPKLGVLDSILKGIWEDILPKTSNYYQVITDVYRTQQLVIHKLTRNGTPTIARQTNIWFDDESINYTHQNLNRSSNSPDSQNHIKIFLADPTALDTFYGLLLLHHPKAIHKKLPISRRPKTWEIMLGYDRWCFSSNPELRHRLYIQEIACLQKLKTKA